MTDGDSEVVFFSYLTECFKAVCTKSFKCRLNCDHSDLGVLIVVGRNLLQRRKAIFMAPWSPFLKEREIGHPTIEVVDIQGVFSGSKVNPFNALP